MKWSRSCLLALAAIGVIAYAANGADAKKRPASPCRSGYCLCSGRLTTLTPAPSGNWDERSTSIHDSRRTIASHAQAVMLRRARLQTIFRIRSASVANMAIAARRR